MTIHNKTTSCHRLCSSVYIWLWYSDMLVSLVCGKGRASWIKLFSPAEQGDVFQGWTPRGNMGSWTGSQNLASEQVWAHGNLTLRPCRVGGGRHRPQLGRGGARANSMSRTHHTVRCYSIPFATLSHLVTSSLNVPVSECSGEFESAVENRVRGKLLPWGSHGGHRRDLKP